jgi:hypothetical protein
VAERRNWLKRSPARLRRVAALRPYLSWGLLVSPLFVVLASDIARRGSRVFTFGSYYELTYVLAMLESLLVWGTLLFAASRSRGSWSRVLSGLFIVGFTLAVGDQRYFHEQYNAYLNVDVSVFATNFMDSVLNQLFADAGNYVVATTPALCFSVAALYASRRVVRPKRW